MVWAFGAIGIACYRVPAFLSKNMTTPPLKQSQSWSFEDDLAFILESTKTIFKSLQGGHIFITGGTGFIGTWLLESLRYANLHLKLNIKATILTRNIKKFENTSPHLAKNSQFYFIQGDVVEMIAEFYERC